MDLITLAAAKAYTDKKSGGGGANIITANSKAELPDPSTVAEGTIAMVPSEGGGGGLPTVVLTTAATAEGAELTDAEVAMVEALNGSPCILTIPYAGMTVSGCADAVVAEGVYIYTIANPSIIIVVSNEGGSWFIACENNS